MLSLIPPPPFTPQYTAPWTLSLLRSCRMWDCGYPPQRRIQSVARVLDEPYSQLTLLSGEAVQARQSTYTVKKAVELLVVPSRNTFLM